MSISEKNHQYYTIHCIPTFGPPCINIHGVNDVWQTEIQTADH